MVCSRGRARDLTALRTNTRSVSKKFQSVEGLHNFWRLWGHAARGRRNVTPGSDCVSVDPSWLYMGGAAHRGAPVDNALLIECPMTAHRFRKNDRMSQDRPSIPQKRPSGEGAKGEDWSIGAIVGDFVASVDEHAGTKNRWVIGSTRRARGTVPQAVVAFLEAADYEEAIRDAISLGGDADTLAAIAGRIAHAYFGEVPEELAGRRSRRCRGTLTRVWEEFRDRYEVTDEECGRAVSAHGCGRFPAWTSGRSIRTAM
jgi:hypothetical protein